MTTNWVGWNNRDWASHGSEDQNQGVGRLHSLWRLRRRTHSSPLSAPSHCVDIPWLVATPFSAPSVSASSLCLCYVLVSLIKIFAVALRAHPSNPGWSLYLRILNLIISAKSLFPKKVTFTYSRFRTQYLGGRLWRGVILQLTRPDFPHHC